jgi:hypothetical protein
MAGLHEAVKFRPVLAEGWYGVRGNSLGCGGMIGVIQSITFFVLLL